MTPLELLAIQEAPSIIAYLKILFTKANPAAPMPSDTAIINAYEAAFLSSVAKDESWLAAHPAL